MAASLRPQKTAMLVARRIMADINRREIGAGDHLSPERVMLQEYNIGRGTLRESLRFLEFLGVISLKPGPGGGPVVQQPDGSSLTIAMTLLMQSKKAPYRTVAEARAALEPMMARLAASRISAEQLALLQRSVDMMGEHLDDQAVFLETNKSFHDIIAHGSGNAMFGFLVDSLIGILDGGSIGIDYPRPRREAVLKAHRTIYEAIASRDEDTSAEAMSRHIAEYLRYAERKFPEVLDAPIVWTSVD